MKGRYRAAGEHLGKSTISNLQQQVLRLQHAKEELSSNSVISGIPVAENLLNKHSVQTVVTAIKEDL